MHHFSWEILYMTFLSFFFFNDTATTEIYTLSLHDALPIFHVTLCVPGSSFLESSVASTIPLAFSTVTVTVAECASWKVAVARSEEHTSELQSHSDLVCRLLLEKKNAT